MKNTPDSKSSDYDAMSPYWHKVSALFGGAESMRLAGKVYLPQFPEEKDEVFRDRLEVACLTNIFRDVVENLASRPFSEEVALSDESAEQLKKFSEDVDGHGNNLHVFAASRMFDAIGYGLDWILVDYTQGNLEGATVAQERAAGVRPVWSHYPAQSVLAAYSATVNGKEEFVHVRLSEAEVIRDGFGEISKERVRVIERQELENGGYGPPTWEVWEKDGDDWKVVSKGNMRGMDVIPLVPFLTGRRKGQTWQYHPAMQDAADLQIEYYQQENGLKYIKQMGAFPMLAGIGVDLDEDNPIIIGPNTVLYTGSNREGGTSDWKVISPDPGVLNFLRADIDGLARELRELGRQPLTAQSGNLTVITTAVAAQKGNSAVQNWALGLKDALELAFDYTARWLKLSGAKAEVQINTDFDEMTGEENVAELIDLMRNQDISRQAFIHEMKRRNVLDRDYDPDADLDAIVAELADDEIGLPADAQAAPGLESPPASAG